MVILNSGTAITSSSTIGGQHFGLNYLVHEDAGTAETDVFASIANNQHETSSIRFPGGTVAEVGAGVEPALDISVNNGVLGNELAGTTLEFLNSADDNDWSVTIVLPMWRFLNVGTLRCP